MSYADDSRDPQQEIANRSSRVVEIDVQDVVSIGMACVLVRCFWPFACI